MPPEPIVETLALTKRFPGEIALDEVSFDLRPGEMHALCGENGAGMLLIILLAHIALIGWLGHQAHRRHRRPDRHGSRIRPDPQP